MASNAALKSIDSANRPQQLMPLESSVQVAYDGRWEADSIDITVAIPTYNGGKRLPAVLEQLKAQTEMDSLNWEVIVADNNSQDDTVNVVRQYQQQWAENVRLRYTFVGEQGAAFARQRAVEIARGRIIAFLDDDNVPAADWVVNAHRFAEAYPQAGAFGSQIHGDFESPLPEEMRHMVCFLAVVERGAEPHLYAPAKKILPPGAGLVVRRQAWLQHVPRRLFLNHKGKKAGLASEDLEAILHIQKAGWEIWYNPKMVVYHQIPTARLQASYLRSLVRCVGLSRFYIRMLGLKEWQRPLMVPAYIANDLRKLALHVLKSGNSSQNISTLCEREHLTSSLQSPFFITRKVLQDTYQGFLEKNKEQQAQTLRWIERGFEENQFQLYQQPVYTYNRSQKGLLHSEVLIRLGIVHPQKTLLLPKEFMAVAETHGLARTIDRWVLRSLLLSDNDSTHSYSINLSEATICDPNFINFLASLLEQGHHKPGQFCFEVSEKIVKANPEAALMLRRDLKVLGCQFGLDNFQQSYVLELFHKDMVDCIKVNLMGQGKINKRNGLIRIQDKVKATQAPITLVAKGVESNQLLTLATTAGIQVLQGHKLAVPHPLIADRAASATS
ncbi:MAG: EAL domain-containing protein [Leptolyngbya sp. SIO1D8]|nr:EAL domain-containing protein [Leptolyngbya sp. SIO1D8]